MYVSRRVSTETSCPDDWVSKVRTAYLANNTNVSFVRRREPMDFKSLECGSASRSHKYHRRRKHSLDQRPKKSASVSHLLHKSLSQLCTRDEHFNNKVMRCAASVRYACVGTSDKFARHEQPMIHFSLTSLTKLANTDTHETLSNIKQSTRD